MRLVFCGTSKDVDRSVLRDHLVRLKPHEVLHGGGSGSETQCDAVCRDLDIPVRVVEANFEKHGRAAQPIRNKLMLGMGDKVLAMPCLRSRGVRTLVKLAMCRGVPLEVHPQ